MRGTANKKQYLNIRKKIDRSVIRINKTLSFKGMIENYEIDCNLILCFCKTCFIIGKSCLKDS